MQDGGARQRESFTNQARKKKKKRKLQDALQKRLAGTGGHMAEVTSVAEGGSAGGLAGIDTPSTPYAEPFFFLICDHLAKIGGGGKH